MCLGAPIIKGAGIEAGRRSLLVACLWLLTSSGALGLSACGAFRGDQFGATTDFNAHAHARGGTRGDAVGGLMLRSEVCEHEDLRVAEPEQFEILNYCEPASALRALSQLRLKHTLKLLLRG